MIPVPASLGPKAEEARPPEHRHVVAEELQVGPPALAGADRCGRPFFPHLGSGGAICQVQGARELTLKGRFPHV